MEPALDKITYISGRSCSDGYLQLKNILNNLAALAVKKFEQYVVSVILKYPIKTNWFLDIF